MAHAKEGGLAAAGGTATRQLKNLLRVAFGRSSIRARLQRELRAEFARWCEVGEDFAVGDWARCYNHSRERERMRIGHGVVIDGIIACHRNGHLEIGDYTFVGRSRIYCTQSISIGRGVLISDNVAVMDGDMHPASAGKRLEQAMAWADEGRFPDAYEDTTQAAVAIGDYAWIGFGACVLKGVSIGKGGIVGAGSVVTKSVPDWTVVGGNPARPLHTLPEAVRTE